MHMQFCPALMDWTVFLVLFAALYGAGERHLSAAQCAWLGGINQITYMLTSIAVGAVLSRRNARALLIVATIGSTVLGVAAILTQAFLPQLICLAFFGVGLALFFNAFQTFMRGETSPGGLATTVGGYTLAWSLGSSAGFLSSGVLYRLGGLTLSGVTILVGIAIMAMLLRHRPRANHEASVDEHVEIASAGARAVNPRYVLVAWLIIFTAMFVQRPIQSLFPAVCAGRGISPVLPGVILALHMAVQGICGWRIARVGAWRYRRTPLTVSHLAAAGALALAWFWPLFLLQATLIVLVGLSMGFSYFAAVYYSSNSGRRSFNIGVNECLVGLGSFAGLFAAEWGMARSGSAHAMFAVCAVALVVSLAAQLVVASWPSATVTAPSPARVES
jgi:predicted MFS family arabinose efflux permease